MPERPPPPAAPRGGAPTGSGERTGSGEQTTRITEVIERRWLPGPSSFVPRPIRRRWRAFLAGLPPEVKERWELVSGIGQAVGLVVGGLLCVGFAVSILSNVTLVEPKSVRAVLEDSPEVDRVAYSIETVRTKRIDGALLRQDSLVGVGVDLRSRKFQLQSNGLFDAPLRVVGDGRTAISQRGQNTPGRLAEYPSADSLRPVLAADIMRRPGRIVTNALTIRTERGWLLTWNPRREDLLRLMGADLLALAGEDVEAIRAGRYDLEYATASVERSSRRIYQIDVLMNVDGAQVHLLLTYRNYEPEGIGDLSLRPPEE